MNAARAFACARLAIVLPGAALLPLGSFSAQAETKCEIHTKSCIDGRTGYVRVCISTICRNESEIISIDTIVLNEGNGAQPAKPKLPRGPALSKEKAK
jgi:hypothetical protein